MSFEAAMGSLHPRDRYKLLSASVVPRPIAFVTSVSEDGVVNAAPFSFFNVFSPDPPVVVLGVQKRFDGTVKDTARNIAANGVFVVNLVDEDLVAAANVAAIDFPPDYCEIDAAGLTLIDGVDVPVPRIAEAPFSLECRRIASLVLGSKGELVIGEIVRFHAREGLVDPERMYVNAQAYRPVARMGGMTYARRPDLFTMNIDSAEEWFARQGEPVQQEQAVAHAGHAGKNQD
ncbi:flavin reductase family protein [Paraburkholderia sediminicola]|uniref:Flavin reductase family protein n=1 Tax=Paraburkholderia metrosideri TaxID=580937 RepID=A0ABW9DVU0_9BURK